MIYITGDTHGEVDINKLSNKILSKVNIHPDKEDYMIILGDFGLPFLDSDITKKRGAYHWWIRWLSQKPYTVLWIDGNHDNFNFWEKQKVTEWHGGQVQVHPDAPNVIHLMRGQIYEIEGKSFFTFGGASSHDKNFRTPNVTWWEQEIASDEEIETAINNLEKNNNTVDYVLTHTPPQKIMQEIFGSSNDKTADFLNYVLKNVKYKMWFCGHIHEQYMFNKENIATLYNGVFLLDDFKQISEVSERI